MPTTLRHQDVTRGDTIFYLQWGVLTATTVDACECTEIGLRLVNPAGRHEFIPYGTLVYRAPEGLAELLVPEEPSPEGLYAARVAAANRAAYPGSDPHASLDDARTAAKQRARAAKVLAKNIVPPMDVMMSVLDDFGHPNWQRLTIADVTPTSDPDAGEVILTTTAGDSTTVSADYLITPAPKEAHS